MYLIRDVYRLATNFRQVNFASLSIFGRFIFRSLKFRVLIVVAQLRKIFGTSTACTFIFFYLFVPVRHKAANCHWHDTAHLTSKQTAKTIVRKRTRNGMIDFGVIKIRIKNILLLLVNELQCLICKLWRNEKKTMQCRRLITVSPLFR